MKYLVKNILDSFAFTYDQKNKKCIEFIIEIQNNIRQVYIH